MNKKQMLLIHYTYKVNIILQVSSSLSFTNEIYQESVPTPLYSAVSFYGETSFIIIYFRLILKASFELCTELFCRGTAAYELGETH